MPPTPASPRPKGLRIIAAIKFIKGIALLALALGLFRLLNRNLSEVVLRAITRLHVDPETSWARLLLVKVGKVKPGALRGYGWVSLGFSVELLAEGVGLWLNQSWAKYLLAVATGTFIPWELYGLYRHGAADRPLLLGFRLVTLVFNIIVTVYIVRLVRRQRRREGPAAG